MFFKILSSVQVDTDGEEDYEPEERPKATPKVEKAQKPANRKLEDHSRPEINVVEQLVEEVRNRSLSVTEQERGEVEWGKRGSSLPKVIC